MCTGGGGPYATGQLAPIPPSQQFNDLKFGTFTRCPGGATQPIAGSNPFTDDGSLLTGGHAPEPEVRHLRRASGAMRRIVAITRAPGARPRWSSSARRQAGRAASYEVRAIFDNGDFLVPGEAVRVAGANVGSVTRWT